MASSGPNSPGTMANDSANPGFTWISINNSKVSDNVYTSSGSNAPVTDLQYLKATNFGFSITSGATINGIVVEVERKASVQISTVLEGLDTNAKLVKGGTISGTNKSTGASWSTTEGYVTFGSSSDLWGLSLTDTDVNSSGFGFAISAQIAGTSKSNCNLYVDHIRITVYYTLSGGSFIASKNIQPNQAVKRASRY